MSFFAARRGAMPSLALGLILCATGCSSFHRQWKAAANHPVPADSIAGRWEGSWRSDVNAHSGRLRCLLTPGTNGAYTARFHANYRLLFPLSYGYTVPLAVTNRQSTFQFQGAAELGWLAGGRYTYKGHATPTNFFSTYSCKYDHGVFEMSRPGAAP